MRLLIRVDSGPGIGLGHLVRCLAVAEAAGATGDAVRLAVAAEGGAGRRLVGVHGIGVEAIGATPGSSADAASLVEMASRGADLVLLDGYGFGDEYESRLVRSGVPFAVMDDHRHAAHEGAVAIVNANANPLPPWSYRDASPSGRLLLGPEFAPLRGEFVALRGRERERADVRRAIVSLGENDAGGFLEQVLEALGTTLPRQAEIWATAPSAAAPSPVSPGLSRSVRWLDDPARLPELMGTADLAVSAGGMTTYEFACLGVPCIVVPAGASQAADAEAFARRGAAVSVGFGPTFPGARFRAAVEALVESPAARREMSAAARALVDGRGAFRIASALAEVVGSPARDGSVA